MALNIPNYTALQNPLMKGIDTGSTLFTRMMNPVLAREKQKQEAEQFAQELALKKQTEARMGANSGLNRQILEQNLLKLKHSNDPQWAMQQLQEKLNYIQNLGNQGGQGGKSSIGGQAPMNLMDMINQGQEPGTPQGQGAMMPKGNNNGMIAPPNIDLNKRPVVKNPDGSISTVLTMGIEQDGKHINIPRVSEDGKILTPEQAKEQFRKTGKHLGVYNSQQAADQAAQQLHEQQDSQYSNQEHQGGNQLPGGLDMEEIKRLLTLQALGIKGGMQNALHGPARDAADLAKLKKEVGENSEVYQNAKNAYDAQLDAKKDLRDLRARTKQGLKPGEKEFFDEQTGEPLGKEIPLTSAERQSEEGNILFNELYPYVYKGAAPFSGEGSIRRLEQAAANYKKDPKARKLFDDFLLAEKMLAATTVNEASTLKAGRTNRTYNMLKESLDAQDVPKTIKKLIKQYGLPASAQLKASMNYQKALSDARQKARKGTPATQKLFYNPEMQEQHEAQLNEEQPHSNEQAEIKEIGGKKYKKIEGEWHEVE